MTVYNVSGVFAEHLNHMGVGRLLSVHSQHMAAAFTILIRTSLDSNSAKSAMQITKKCYSLLLT